MLKIDKLSKNYNTKRVLKDVSFTLDYFDKVVVAGVNGSGKSTLLKILAGISPYKGGYSVSRGYIEGTPETIPTENDYIPVSDVGVQFYSRVSYLGHDIGLYNNITVYENLKFFYKFFNKLDTKEAKDYMEHRIDDILSHFGILKYRNTQVSNLSRGLKQRTALSKLIINDPYLMVLDEPFTGLDKESAVILGDFIRNSACSFVIATHDYKFFIDSINRVLVLENGILTQDISTVNVKELNEEYVTSLYSNNDIQG